MNRLGSPLLRFTEVSIALSNRLYLISNKVYGGGHFQSNVGLNVSASHLFAVYSGGELNLDHAGYRTQLSTEEGSTIFRGPGQGFGEEAYPYFFSQVVNGRIQNIIYLRCIVICRKPKQWIVFFLEFN